MVLSSHVGLNNEYYFNDYNHNTVMGEPRDFYFEINKSVSHVSVLNLALDTVYQSK